MATMDEPTCRVKRTALVRWVDWVCGALLIGLTLWVACRYGSLPERIATHYGADGVIDGYGPKSMIWVVVAIAWIMAGVMSAAEQFPRLWNVPAKVTEENRQRLLTLTWHLASTTKLIVLGNFAYLTIMGVRGGNLSAYFLPVFLGALAANCLYWIVRIFLNRDIPCKSRA